MIIPFAPRRLWTTAALAAVIAEVTGVVAALHYHSLGLTLSHYDARGHLIVARRIFDSITPGWQQIGAVWLPLPHLINALPAQIDFFYRTGASGVAISVVSFGVATGAITWIVAVLCGSELAALAAAMVFVLNPNVLYLQSTPMTEPLLLALTTLGVALTIESVRRPGTAWLGHAAGIVLALACLTRYEAWPVTLTTIAMVLWTRWRASGSMAQAVRDVVALAGYAVVAIVGFMIVSRVVIGEWFVANGFFVVENKALGDLWLAAKEIGWGVEMLSRSWLVLVGGLGLGVAAARALLGRPESLLVLALLTTAATPLAAFYKGHPFRIRYMVPLLAAQAIGVGLAAGAFHRLRVPAAAAAAAFAIATLRPLNRAAPMVVEAQWDRPNTAVRAEVTACLQRPLAGGKIMASMGSLGHYMQETSRSGLELRDFLHEGNGDIWLAALDDPRPFAEWILVEEKAEGGDALAHIAREHPRFLDGYSRVCEGAGLALYRRVR
ncbi:MAG TPA: phospholipid carrier-dependent glycosyltransferase [Vicinamibacterales bacterium]